MRDICTGAGRSVLGYNYVGYLFELDSLPLFSAGNSNRGSGFGQLKRLRSHSFDHGFS
jgi:hypothetical protein